MMSNISLHSLLSRYRLVLLGIIILFSAVVRLYHLDTLPPGIYPDEAQNGYDAFRSLQDGTWKLFYPDNNGREGLFMILIGGVFALFGVGVWQLKLVSALCGIATVAGTYLLGREVFWRRRDGVALSLLSAALMAGSLWHINFSRIAFRAILLPLILTLSAWLLLRAVRLLRSGRTRSAAFSALGSGIIFGIGLHTYIAWRIAPLVWLVLLIGLLWVYTRHRRALLSLAATVLVGATLSAAPLLYTFAQHPEYLSSRSADISVFSQDANIIPLIAKNIVIMLGMFVWHGDQNYRHGYPPHSALEPVAAVAAVIGLLAMLCIAGRMVFSRRRSVEGAIAWFLLTWFALLLSPAFLTMEGLPHALRSIGVLPVVYLFAATGIGTIWTLARRAPSPLRTTLIVITLLLSLHTIARDTTTYFTAWAQSPQLHEAFRVPLRTMAEDILRRSDNERPIVVHTGALERLVVRLLTRDDPSIYYIDKPADIATIPAARLLYVTDCRALYDSGAVLLTVHRRDGYCRATLRP